MHNPIQGKRSPPWVIYILIWILIYIMIALVLLRRTVSDSYYCAEWVLWCNRPDIICLEHEKNLFVQWWIQLFARGRLFSRKRQTYILQTFSNKSQEEKFRLCRGGDLQHPAGTSKESDKCDSIKRFWFSVLMVVYEKFSFSNIQPIWVKICGKYIYRKM